MPQFTNTIPKYLYDYRCPFGSLESTKPFSDDSTYYPECTSIDSIPYAAKYKPISVGKYPGVVLVPNADIFNYHELKEKYGVNYPVLTIDDGHQVFDLFLFSVFDYDRLKKKRFHTDMHEDPPHASKLVNQLSS